MNENNVETVNNFELTYKVFTDPKSAFEKVKAMPHWIFPILVTFLISYAFNIFTADIQLEFKKKVIMDMEILSEDQKDEALDDLEYPSFYKKNIEPVIVVLLSTFIIPLLIAAVLLMFGNFVHGGNASFLVVFSSVAWAGLIGGLEVLVKLPLVLYNGTLEVYTSLALLMDLSQSRTFFFQFLNIFDVFTVWKVIVYSSAFMVIYKFSSTKSYATIITLTLVASLIGIGFSQLFR